MSHDDPVHGGIVIEEVDGKWRGTGLIKTYRLAPGRHSLSVRINRAFYTSGKVVRWIDVKAGRRYIIQGLTDEGRDQTKKWDFWVIDIATKTRVDRSTP